ncbi:MAG: 4Fe-4S dicluster domain-containing protein [Desulfovibrio sp.]|uniref:4Fe-4S dicluster domain-containing protein n=1 Tax=Desulfovibrio sp. 7SRBS1 TaxID=3378064 RepID=UPI003B4208EE
MSDYRIKLDKKRCIGCHACEVHCKLKNSVPVGVQYNKIISSGLVDKDGKPHIAFKYQPCMHCKKPQCVDACPNQAIYIREPDKLVLVRTELCDACGQCIEACPWSVPVIRPDTGKMAKCDFCVDRVDAGLDPACVTGCTAKALVFVRP